MSYLMQLFTIIYYLTVEVFNMQTQINAMLIIILVGTGVIAFALWLELIVEIIERIVKLIVFVLNMVFLPIRYLFNLAKEKTWMA